jgi:hypothetical protein
MPKKEKSPITTLRPVPTRRADAGEEADVTQLRILHIHNTNRIVQVRE